MLSKRNYKERLRQMEQKTERFSIRKLTVGVASVLIGISFLGFNGHTAKAATTEGVKPNQEVANTQTVKSADDQSKLNISVNSSAAASSADAATEQKASQAPASESVASSAASSEEVKADLASSSAAVNSEASSEVAVSAKSVAASSAASSASESVASSAAKDDNIITSNSNGVVTGKNAQGTWAAKDATTPAAPEAYKNTANVDDWQSFANALNDASVDNINLTKDVTVTGAVNGITGSSAFHYPRYKGLMELDGTNVARKLTITGNGNTLDFGKYYLEFQDKNQKDGGSWDLTVDNTKVKAGDVASVEAGQYPPFYFGEVSADNQKKDTITFKDIDANISDRGLVRGAKGHDHGSEYITVVLKGNNTIYDKANQEGSADSGSTISAGYVRVEDGSTSIEMTDAGSGSNNYGGDAIRTAQKDVTENGAITKYTFDIAKGATLNIKGGKDVRGIFAVDGTQGTVNIDGNINMNLGTGHSMAVFAGNLNVGKDGVLDVTTAYDATPDWGQIPKSFSNFNGGQYGVLSIGNGNPVNLTNQDSNTINDNGVIRVKVTSTNEGMNPIISMGSGSSGLIKGNFTINVNQGATLDLQSSRTQTDLGMIYVSGSSVDSHLNIINPKYVNLQRLNTPLPKNGSDLIYLEGGNNGINITNSPIAEWQAANMSTAPNFTWMIQSVNSMNNWGTNAKSGLTVAGQDSPQNKDGQDKFLYSNGKVIMAPSQSGTNSFEYNGSQTVNKNSNQGIIVQGSGSQAYYTPYLNQFLNNYNYWESQRLAMGSSLLTPDSPVKSHDNDLYEPETQTINGTTKQTLNDLDPNKGIKDLQKASMDANGNWTSTTVPVDGIVKSVAWYTSTDATDWANTMEGQDTPTNPEGNLKTTDKSAWAKVTYEDGSIDFVNIPLNITNPDNDVYEPSYKDTDVKQGANTTIPVSFTKDGKPTETVPKGTTYKIDDGFTAPEGAEVTVDPNTGSITIKASDKTPTGEFDVPVTVTYPDKTTDEATAKVTITPSDANEYNPAYNPVNVNKGGSVETGIPTYTDKDDKTTKAPEGTEYTIPEGTKLPTGVTATVDPSTGNVTVKTSDNTPEGVIDVPVTVTYPDGTTDTIDAPIIVGSNTFIGTDYSVTVETGLDNLHETTENSMAPNAKDLITKITWWNNNDVRAGKNLAGNVIYDKANGTGNLDDITVEWTNPINTNVDKATMGGTLAGTDTVTVNKENPAIKITYGANSQLIKDTGNGLFTTQGGSQTAQWYGKVTVQGAEAKNPAEPVDVTAGVKELTSDQIAALINTDHLVPPYLTANNPVSYEWATPLKKGDTQGTVKITFSDKAADGQATYLNVELPAGSINVTDPTEVVNPTNPNDDSQKDLFTTVKRTINVTNPETGKTTSTPQSVTFARTKTIDKITGETVSYGDYKVWENNAQSDKTTGSFAEFDVPQITGYTSLVDGNAATKVAADDKVTPETKSSTVNVTYTADKQTRKIIFVDNGDTVGTQTLTGKTGTSVTIGNGDGETPLDIPTGYELVPNTTIPKTVPFNADSKDNGDITVQVQAKVDTDDGRNDHGNKDVYREVTRTITVNMEGQAPQTDTQTLAFYRTKSTNEVTGKVTYTDWTSDMTDGSTNFPDFGIPSAAGYNRTITGGTITTKDGKDYVAAQSGLENGEPVNNITVTVNYVYSDQTATIKYVNNADHNDVVGTQVVPGKTGETVPVTLQVPANWKLVPGQKVPSSFTFGSKPLEDTIVYVEHGTKDVTNDPSQADKVNKTITRTIDLDIAGKTSEYTKQTATLHRTATEDLVTGEVTYSAWNVDGAKFDAVTAPEEAGYTVTNPNAAAEVAITGETEDSTVTFTYTANNQTRKIVFVDGDNTVGTQTLTGKTGTSVTIGNKDGETPLDIPTGYELVPNTKIPTIVPFNADSKDNGDITVQVQAKVDTDDGRNDHGNKDVYREVTRTITVNMEGQAPQTGTQTLAFYRTKSTNEVTGKVTYTDWTSDMTDGSTSFPDFGIPSAAGYNRTITGGTITTKDGKDYVAAQSGLENGEPVNNITVTVNYVYSDQTATIKYVNNADHNDVVGTQVVPGKTGEIVPVKLEVPANWKLVPGQKVPSSFTFGLKPLEDTIVYVEHGTKDVTDDPSQADKVNKTITRTIDLDIAGKTSEYTKQTVILHRSATQDLVTGEVTYGAWNVDGAKFKAVAAPEEAGYTVTNPNAAPAMDVTAETEDSTVTFVYKGNTPTYGENATGTPIVTEQGVEPNPSEGIGNKDKLDPKTQYTWTNGEPDVSKIGKSTVTITVHYPDGKTQNVDTPLIVTGTEIPTNPNDPSQSDLFTKVTRTINGTTPDGKKVSDQPEEVIFARTKSVDKTGKESYGKYQVFENGKQTGKTTGSFAEVDVPQVDGYTSYVDGKAATEVPAVNDVTPETKSSTVNVTYTEKGKTPTYGENATGTPIVTEQGVEPNPSEGIGNKDKLDPKTQYTWTNGEPDVSKIGKSTVTITVHYPDGKTQNVDTPLIVTGTEIPTNPNDPSQSDLFTYVTRNINTTTPDGKTTTERQKVTFARTKTVDKSGETTYSDYTVYNTDTNKLTNDKEATLPKVSVTQIDGYTSLVDGKSAKEVPALSVNAESKPADVNVTYTENGKTPTPTNDSDKYTPEPKPITTDKGVMPDPSQGIGNKDDMPQGTKYTWTDGEPDVNTVGTKPVTITVTYPDGSTDEVPTTITVKEPTPNPTDSDKYTPEGQPITTDKGVMPDPSEGIHNKGDLPDGTKYSWTNGEPDVNTAGTKPVTITVTYPDGSTDTVTTTITVENPSTPVVPTDADTHVPEPAPITTDKGVMPDPSQGIGNKDDMPQGTKYTWTDGEPDVNTVGTKPVTITVTYPDGSVDNVTTTITVNDSTTPAPTNDSDKYTPEPAPITTDKGHTPDPSQGIGNKDNLPTGTTYTWTNGAPDVNTVGTHDVSITVTYPDGSTDIVTTTITVTDGETAPVHNTDGNGNNGNGTITGNGTNGVQESTINTNGNGNVAHTSFYNTNNGNKNNGNANNANAKTLPQTGAEANMAGALGLMIASVGAILGLAADKKRKN